MAGRERRLGRVAGKTVWSYDTSSRSGETNRAPLYYVYSDKDAKTLNFIS